MMTHSPVDKIARTQALRQLLSKGLPDSAVADLIYLEAWEREPAPGVAAARRVGQIRRAQPTLAAAIRRELSRKP
jgi:hypothetical protein